MSSENIGRIISGVVGLGVLGGGVYLLASGEAEQGAGLLAAGLAIVGGLGTMATRGVRATPKPPANGAEQ